MMNSLQCISVQLQPPGSAALLARLFQAAALAPDERSGFTRRAPNAWRVLLVEDDFIVSAAVESALNDADISVVAIARSAEEAVRFAAVEKPDLVVMDIRLEGKGDGVEAALKIFAANGIRPLFATAYHDAEMRLRAEPARPIAWVPKPYRMDVLVSSVLRALEELDKEPRG
jgi:DNA-binding NarL/FixJ family response regulator